MVRLWEDPAAHPDGRGGRTSFDKDVLTLTPGDLRVVVFTQPATAA